MTCWIIVAFVSALVEVGGDCHGLYSGFVENSVGL
jgi:hypothetical protein